MSKLLMESLKLDMPALAKLIQARGRKGDTILAHISPKEAALLKKRGGAGTKNPDTGLPEFDDGEGVDAYAGGTSDQIAAQNAANQAPATPASPVYDVVNQQGQFQPTFTETKGAQAGAQIPVGQSYTPGNVPTDYSQFDIGFGPGKYGPPTTAADIQGRTFTPQESAMYGYTTPSPNIPQPPQTFLDKLGTSLSEPANLAKLGLVGGLGVLGTQKAKQAAAQNQAAQAEQTALGAPYQQMGKQMVAQGQAGELTPSSQAAYQAAQARLNQDIATRGGVGVQQAANQSAALYSQLLQNQTQYGLQVAGIGDSYQINAIQTGLALDQQTNQNLQNYYAALSAVAFGIPMRTTTP